MPSRKIASGHIDVIAKDTSFKKQMDDNVKRMNKMEKQVKKTQKRLKAFNKAGSKVVETLKAFAGVAFAGAGFSALNEKMKELVTTASEAEAKFALINNTIAGTDVSIDRIEQMSQAVNRLVGGNLNETREIANQLVAVSKGSDAATQNLERTFNLAADLAKGGYGDLKGNIEELSEIFVLPKEAVTTLEKYGVFFDDAAKRHLDYLVDTGKELEAIELIYDKMEQKFSGSAAAAATGLTGAVNRRNTELQLLNETLGGIISEGFNLEGIFNSLADSASNFRHWLDRTFGEGQQEFAGMSDTQLRHQLAVARRDLGMLPDNAVDPGSLEGYDIDLAADEEGEEARRELNKRINAITKALDARELADATNEWNKTLEESAKIRQEYDAKIQRQQNARAMHRDQGRWADRLGGNVVGGLEAMKESEKNAKKLTDEAKKRYQTVEDTIKATKKELEFQQLAIGYSEKQQAIARKIWDLGQKVNEDMTQDQINRLYDAESELYDLEMANQKAEEFKQSMTEVYQTVAEGLTTVGKSMVEMQLNGEFSLKKLRSEGLDTASSIAAKFADKTIWDPFEQMITQLFDKVVGYLGDQLSDIDWGSGPAGDALGKKGNLLNFLFGNPAGAKQDGGRVQMNKAYKVHKDEMFVPDRNGYVYSKNDLRSMGGGGGDLVFAPTINSNDPDMVEAKMREMMPEFAQFAGEQMTYDKSRPGKIKSAFES